MQRIINTSTKTVHKPGEEDTEAAACGVLRNVPGAQTRVVTSEEIGSDEVDRCGNCFDDGGGY